MSGDKRDAVRIAVNAAPGKQRKPKATWPHIQKDDRVTWASRCSPKHVAVFEEDLGKPPYRVEGTTPQHSQQRLQRGVLLRSLGGTQLDFPEDNFVLHEED